MVPNPNLGCFGSVSDGYSDELILNGKVYDSVDLNGTEFTDDALMSWYHDAYKKIRNNKEKDKSRISAEIESALK